MRRAKDVRVLLTVTGAALLFAGAASATDDQTDIKKAPDDAARIASAVSAAPPNLSKNATIIMMEKDGKMRTLRQGNNGWTCMPDDPKTPGPDPMCADKSGMEFLQAWMEKKTPPAGKVGFVYMLKGGVDASNTDPYQAAPEPGKKWIRTGPHVMVTGADQSFYDQYPKSPTPDTTVPFVMWPGTPYQHLMAPAY
jgi:hypothetical protein